jgi:hypothetical protein
MLKLRVSSGFEFSLESSRLASQPGLMMILVVSRAMHYSGEVLLVWTSWTETARRILFSGQPDQRNPADYEGQILGAHSKQLARKLLAPIHAIPDEHRAPRALVCVLHWRCPG